jgi:DinB superfamily
MRHELFVGWFDFYRARTAERLAGLTDAEYLWEPVPGCWSVRPNPDGDGFVVDGAEPAPDPPPLTTIAWRLVHVCGSLTDHWLRAVAFERGRADFHLPTDVPPTAADGIALFTRACDKWRADIDALDDARLDELMGPGAGPFADEVVATFVEHIHDELIHHTAEIALLRDLYRATAGAPLAG